MFCREITDPQFHSQKLSAKSAKDLYDKFQKLEKDYQHQFSGNFLIYREISITVAPIKF